MITPSPGIEPLVTFLGGECSHHHTIHAPQRHYRIHGHNQWNTDQPYTYLYWGLKEGKPIIVASKKSYFAQKAAKISNKNLFFNWVHFLHTGSMNASHSTNLFTNSCDHIFTNGKAALHSHINDNNPQFLYSL